MGDNKLLEAALNYAAHGFAVFPLTPGGKDPDGALAPKGFNSATWDPNQIRQWWWKSPNANVGVATEKSNLVVVDIDVKNGKDGRPAVADKDLSGSLHVTTPHNGFHYWYKMPKDREIQSGSNLYGFDGLDIRARGAYIIAPPSIVDSKEYLVTEGDIEHIAYAPDWLFNWDAERQEQRQAMVGDYGAVEPGEYGDDRIARARAYVAKMPPAISQQQGHNSLLKVATKLMVDFLLTEEDAMTILREDYNPRCQPPWSEGELLHKVRDAAKNSLGKEPGTLVAPPKVTEPPESVATPQIEPFPVEALNCGGLIGDIMRHTLDCSNRRNTVLAWAGAVSFVSMVAARGWRTQEGTKSPMYIVGLAPSSSGKSFALETNRELALAIDMRNHVRENFASGEAVQDDTLTFARYLCQIDEFHDFMAQISDTGGARNHALSIAKELKAEFSTRLLTRRSLARNAVNEKVAKSVPPECYNPGLCLYGAGVTEYFGEAVTEKMARDGFYARLLIVVSDERQKLCAPLHPPLDDALIEKLKYIAGWCPPNPDGSQNETWWQNNPAAKEPGFTIPRSPEAEELHSKYMEEADDYYDAENDGMGNALWGRAMEKTSKLELILALSRILGNAEFSVSQRGLPLLSVKPESLRILPEDVLLAKKVVWHCTLRALSIYDRFAVSNDYEKIAKRIKEILRKLGGKAQRWKCLKRSKELAKDFDEALKTLVQNGEVEVDNEEQPDKAHWLWLAEEDA